MDLISRKSVVDAIYKRDERLQKCEIYRNKGDRIDLLGVLPEIHGIPPVFHGMTNGEVIQALFPEIDTHDFGITVHATERVTCCGDKHCRGSISYDFWKEWWNAPYKAESEE